MENARETTGRGGLRGRVEEEMNGAFRVDLNGEEQRRLALRHRLEQVRMVREAGRQGRQVAGELQKELQPVTIRKGYEVLGYLLQLRIKRFGGHGFSPRLMGTRTLLPHSVHDPS